MLEIITFVVGFISGMYVVTQIEKGINKNIEQSLHDEHGNINTWAYWKRKHDNLQENIAKNKKDD